MYRASGRGNEAGLSPGRAHELYHSQTDSAPLYPPKVYNVISGLEQGVLPDDAYDRGWLAADTAIVEPSPNRAAELVQTARKDWEKVARQDDSPLKRTQARLALAYLPLYEQYTTSSPYDYQTTLQQLAELNQGLLEQLDSGARNLSGIATETAAGYLLVKQAAETEESRIAWPAASWQNCHWTDDETRVWQDNPNFDFRFGHFPINEANVQVKSRIDTGIGKIVLESGQPFTNQSVSQFDGDQLLAIHQGRYADNIVMVFGDVHMGNTREDPHFINRAIAEPDGQEKYLYLATRNLTDEIDSQRPSR